MTHTVLGMVLLNNLAASWIAPFMAFQAAVGSLVDHDGGPGHHKVVSQTRESRPS